MGLLEEWAAWKADSAPYLLESDRQVVNAAKHLTIRNYDTWEQVYKDPAFGAPGDSHLHLGLLPHPFCGDLLHARVYVLLLNPGYGPADYYDEFVVPGFRDVLISNLHQECGPESMPFLFLDPQHAGRGGFRWWHDKKFAQLIEQLSRDWQVSFAEARARFSRMVASIELVPYHSASFQGGADWWQELHSVKLVREFVSSVVMPRVQAREAIVIVTRQVRVWDLPEVPDRVIKYTSGQARGASLGPQSPGGAAILQFLKDKLS